MLSFLIQLCLLLQFHADGSIMARLKAIHFSWRSFLSVAWLTGVQLVIFFCSRFCSISLKRMVCELQLISRIIAKASPSCLDLTIIEKVIRYLCSH